MLIKNNKIIVRKCSKDTSDLIFKSGFKLHATDGKILIVPFSVFNENDLFDLLSGYGIKYYAIPLNGSEEGNTLSLIVNEGKLLSTYNTICRNDDSFLEDNNFTSTIDLIRKLSYTFEKNSRATTYDHLIKCLNRIVKNPLYDNIDISLANIGDNLNKFLNNKLRADSSITNDTIQTLIILLRNELNILNIDTNKLAGSEFIRICLERFVIFELRRMYSSADFVFWYNGLNEINSKN